MQLTDRRQRFVDEYLIDLNATQAAIRAGYSQKTAGSQGERLLKNVEIQTAIQAKQAKQGLKAEVDAVRVLKEYICVGLADIGDIMDFTNGQLRLRPPNEIPEHARRAIAAVKVKRYIEGAGDDAREVEITEFRLWSKLDALKEISARISPLPLIQINNTNNTVNVFDWKALLGRSNSANEIEEKIRAASNPQEALVDKKEIGEQTNED